MKTSTVWYLVTLIAIGFYGFFLSMFGFNLSSYETWVLVALTIVAIISNGNQVYNETIEGLK